MALSIKDVPRLLAQAYRALKPGGWIELQDFLYITDSDDGSKPDGYKYDQFVKTLREGFLKFGFDLHGQQKNEGMVKDAGFVNVDNKMYKVLIGTWPKDKGLKKAGLYNKAIILTSSRLSWPLSPADYDGPPSRSRLSSSMSGSPSITLTYTRTTPFTWSSDKSCWIRLRRLMRGFQFWRQSIYEDILSGYGL